MQSYGMSKMAPEYAKLRDLDDFLKQNRRALYDYLTHEAAFKHCSPWASAQLGKGLQQAGEGSSGRIGPDPAGSRQHGGGRGRG